MRLLHHLESRRCIRKHLLAALWTTWLFLFGGGGVLQLDLARAVDLADLLGGIQCAPRVPCIGLRLLLLVLRGSCIDVMSSVVCHYFTILLVHLHGVSRGKHDHVVVVRVGRRGLRPRKDTASHGWFANELGIGDAVLET